MPDIPKQRRGGNPGKIPRQRQGGQRGGAGGHGRNMYNAQRRDTTPPSNRKGCPLLILQVLGALTATVGVTSYGFWQLIT